jgi:hypothetical protein
MPVSAILCGMLADDSIAVHLLKIQENFGEIDHCIASSKRAVVDSNILQCQSTGGRL